MRLATQQEPEKLKVMARRLSDGSSLFSAEVPNGPFRTCPVTTEAVAAPLHPLHVAPAMPTVVAPNARDQATLLGECRTDSQLESTPEFQAWISCQFLVFRTGLTPARGSGYLKFFLAAHPRLAQIDILRWGIDVAIVDHEDDRWMGLRRRF
jgi:hypothetical protein